MLPTRFSSACFIVLALSTFACHAATGEEADSAGGAATGTGEFGDGAPEVLPFTIQSRNSERVDRKCKITTSDLAVTGGGPDTSARIAEQLEELERRAFDGRDCSAKTFEYSSEMSRKSKGTRFMSILQIVRLAEEDQVHEATVTRGHNFDLVTGDTLGARSLLTAAGVAKAAKACAAALPQDDVATDQARAACADALGDGAAFTFGPRGLRVHPNTGAASLPIQLEGVLVPWSVVEGDMTAVGFDIRELSR